MKTSPISIVALLVSVLALSVALIGKPLSFRKDPAKLLQTPEDALKNLPKIARTASFEELRMLERLERESTRWPYVDPSSVTIAKMLTIEDSGDEEYNGRIMCFVTFKGEDAVPKHEVVILRKTQSGAFVPSYYPTYVSNATRSDTQRIEARKSWESLGRLD